MGHLGSWCDISQSLLVYINRLQNQAVSIKDVVPVSTVKKKRFLSIKKFSFKKSVQKLLISEQQSWCTIVVFHSL